MCVFASKMNSDARNAAVYGVLSKQKMYSRMVNTVQVL